MNYCLGNARFIRAYCYFWIARVWGDAPVITTPTEGTGEAIYPSRHPVAEVYARIEDDLNAAAGYIRTMRRAATMRRLTTSICSVPTSRSGCMRRAGGAGNGFPPPANSRQLMAR